MLLPIDENAPMLDTFVLNGKRVAAYKEKCRHGATCHACLKRIYIDEECYHVRMGINAHLSCAYKSDFEKHYRGMPIERG
jgi:hypothetical protein